MTEEEKAKKTVKKAAAPKSSAPKEEAPKKTKPKAQDEKQCVRGLRRERQGVVVSDKMQKTIVVQVTRLVPHPVYGRVMKRKAKAVAHDEKEIAKIGDKVRIIETRPLSKTKRWNLVEVIKQ